MHLQLRFLSTQGALLRMRQLSSQGVGVAGLLLSARRRADLRPLVRTLRSIGHQWQAWLIPAKRKAIPRAAGVTGGVTAVGSRNEEARSMKAGFSLRIVVRERRYAELGNLLPMSSIEPAVKPGVSALPHWLISYWIIASGCKIATICSPCSPECKILVRPYQSSYTSLTFSAHGPFWPRPSV